ncbi:hypothetical protein G3I15_31250, partial [Streptomyces sp. SID10244]|nr:hypothetical protein [Streptomyces sp. SID10244]
FKVYLIPHKGAKTEADAAMTFVKDDELTDEQRAVMDQVQTIIRDKKVPVSDLESLLPTEVVERVSAKLKVPFNMTIHTQAWKFFGVRPPSGADDPEKTR